MKFYFGSFGFCPTPCTCCWPVILFNLLFCFCKIILFKIILFDTHKLFLNSFLFQRQSETSFQ